mmetsp:Transcript_19302/g.49503  ORF Transcript_19302/g.49503 Transcript_19302/m.49503 type:complete len:85 (+) Transcript_19302:651-905(+)
MHITCKTQNGKKYRYAKQNPSVGFTYAHTNTHTQMNKQALSYTQSKYAVGFLPLLERVMAFSLSLLTPSSPLSSQCEEGVDEVG